MRASERASERAGIIRFSTPGPLRWYKSTTLRALTQVVTKHEYEDAAESKCCASKGADQAAADIIVASWGSSLTYSSLLSSASCQTKRFLFCTRRWKGAVMEVEASPFDSSAGLVRAGQIWGSAEHGAKPLFIISSAQLRANAISAECWQRRSVLCTCSNH